MSSQVVVTFVGICTHVQSVPLTPPPDAIGGTPLPPGRYHRTILVNGRLGLRLGKSYAMPPHDPLLVIPNDFLDGEPGQVWGLERVPSVEAAIWKMEGVTMYVPDAKAGMDIVDEFYLVPSLTDRAKVLSLQLDQRVVLDGRAAGTFDIFAGTLSAFQHKDAMFGELTVDTVDAPALSVTQNWNQKTAKIKLKEATIEGVTYPPLVFVMNVGRDNTDDPIDFLMHYDVTTATPDPALMEISTEAFGTAQPMTERQRKFIDFIPGGLTVGCSNSVYP